MHFKIECGDFTCSHRWEQSSRNMDNMNCIVVQTRWFGTTTLGIILEGESKSLSHILGSFIVKLKKFERNSNLQSLFLSEWQNWKVSPKNESDTWKCVIRLWANRGIRVTILEYGSVYTQKSQSFARILLLRFVLVLELQFWRVSSIWVL